MMREQPVSVPAAADRESFIAALVSALEDDDPQRVVERVLADCLQAWDGRPEWLPPATCARLEMLHESPGLTVMHVVWPPFMSTEPHDHGMWATLGLYQGRENNILWARDAERRLVAVGAHSIGRLEVFSLPADAIHSVNNPVNGYTGAIHVYGGDFLNSPKREWDPLDFTERARDLERTRAAFEAADSGAGEEE
jgi:predicted metal-dependent enzyme (double-stranded beta helix superfamily)